MSSWVVSGSGSVSSFSKNGSKIKKTAGRKNAIFLSKIAFFAVGGLSLFESTLPFVYKASCSSAGGASVSGAWGCLLTEHLG